MEKLNDVTPALAGPRTQRSRSRRKPGGGGCWPCPEPPPGVPPAGERDEERARGGGTAAASDRWQPLGAQGRPQPRGLAAPGAGKPGRASPKPGPPSLPPSPPGRPRCGGEGGAPRGSGAATVSLPRPAGGGTPRNGREKPLPPRPLFVQRAPRRPRGETKRGGPRGGTAAPGDRCASPAHMHSRRGTTTSGVTLFIPFPMA